MFRKYVPPKFSHNVLQMSQNVRQQIRNPTSHFASRPVPRVVIIAYMGPQLGVIKPTSCTAHNDNS